MGNLLVALVMTAGAILCWSEARGESSAFERRGATAWAAIFALTALCAVAIFIGGL